MSLLDVAISIFGSGVFLAAFGWIFQLGSRVTSLETRDVDYIKLMEAEFKGVNYRLDRIERSMNGSPKHE